MSRKTERELRSGLEDLASDRDASIDDVTVKWRDAAPDERTEGMTWAPRGESKPATLIYDVWDAQRETLDALQTGEHDLVAFLAGYGSGKSVFGARWLLANALEHPGSRFLAMGVDFQKARDTTYPKLFAQLPGKRTTLTTSAFNGPENSPLVADYNRQQHRLTLVNDSVVTLGSADKYSRYAGAEFGAVWMDEPSHYGDDLHDLTGMITTRLRGVDGPKTMLWTLTGEGYNAAWEILEKRQDVDGSPIGLDIAVIRASVLDNPYLSDGDKERFKRKYEGTAKEQQALHGGFTAATGLVYASFSRETHVIEHAEALDRIDDTDKWRIYGYDAGWNDPRVLLELGKTPYEQLIVLDEFHAGNSHVEDAIRWLTVNDKPKGPIFAEHEPSDIEKFKQTGYPATEAEKSLDAGIAEVRKRLQPDGANVITSPGGKRTVRRGTRSEIAEQLAASDGWEKNGPGRYRQVRPTIGTRASDSADNDRDPDGAPRDREKHIGLLVSERCQHLIREFLGYKEAHVGTSQAVDHCLDSLRYACMGVSSGEADRLPFSFSGTW